MYSSESTDPGGANQSNNIFLLKLNLRAPNPVETNRLQLAEAREEIMKRTNNAAVIRAVIVAGCLFGLSLTLPLFADSTATANTAATQPSRIKALTQEELDGYLNGYGMGLAKAVELNHYPGPKHVLEFTQELKLTNEQIASTKQIFNEMQRRVLELGEQIVKEEQRLDKLCAAGKATEGDIEKIVKKIAQLRGDLRFAHMRAHLQTKTILTAEQVKKYDQLRGYAGN